MKQTHSPQSLHKLNVMQNLKREKCERENAIIYSALQQLNLFIFST